VLSTVEQTGKKPVVAPVQNPDKPSIDNSAAVKPSAIWARQRMSLDRVSSDASASAAKPLSAGAIGQKSFTYSAKMVSPTMDSNREKSLANGNGFTVTKKADFGHVHTTTMTPSTTAQSGSRPEKVEPIGKFSSAHSPTPPPPPPPPPVMPVEPKLRQPTSLAKDSSNFGGSRSFNKSATLPRANIVNEDPRVDLMASIRNFGGSNGLRKTPTNGH